MKGCAITPRCDVSDAKAERGREFDSGRAITKTKRRAKKEGEINCQGIQGEEQMRVKESQVHGAFERNDPLVACEPPFFATFSIYALPRIVSILFYRYKLRLFLSFFLFFQGILNYDEEVHKRKFRGMILFRNVNIRE